MTYKTVLLRKTMIKNILPWCLGEPSTTDCGIMAWKNAKSFCVEPKRLHVATESINSKE